MWRSLDNPVAAQAGRGTRGWRLAGAVAALVAVLVLATGLLQQYWYQYDIYVGRRPHLYYRWFLLLAAAEALLLPPWSGIRAAALWQRLRDQGHLDEYRRTRLSSLAIVLGTVGASLKPQALCLALSTALGAVAALGYDGSVTVAQVVAAHAVVLVICAAFAAAGQALASRLRLAAAAAGGCVALMLLATGGVALLTPFYRTLGAPAGWIYAALLPNPVAAVAAALNWDVLRTPWLYEMLQAADYAGAARVTPWPGETALLYAVAGAVILGGHAGRLRRLKE
ncbi:MAG: hypothetical protein HY320_02265 [Armatimonadetes bacterium]|nr:hypothetical protein [Armatimonadota bacterium]